MLRPDALVFDLDGTLIDSRRDITTAINRMRAELGLPPLALEQVVLMVGEGARTLVERALPERPDQVAHALGRYLAHYEQVCLETTRPYPEIPGMLSSLSARYPLALLSNKGEALSRKILDGLDLARHFREILGGDSLATRKPDPSGLRLLAERLKVPVERLLLVGDTWIDAETARNAGCAFALVEWGFPRSPKMDGLKPDLRAATAGELAAALAAVKQVPPSKYV